PRPFAGLRQHELQRTTHYRCSDGSALAPAGPAVHLFATVAVVGVAGGRGGSGADLGAHLPHPGAELAGGYLWTDPAAGAYRPRLSTQLGGTTSASLLGRPVLHRKLLIRVGAGSGPCIAGPGVHLCSAGQHLCRGRRSDDLREHHTSASFQHLPDLRPARLVALNPVPAAAE